MVSFPMRFDDVLPKKLAFKLSRVEFWVKIGVLIALVQLASLNRFASGFLHSIENRSRIGAPKIQTPSCYQCRAMGQKPPIFEKLKISDLAILEPCKLELSMYFSSLSLTKDYNILEGHQNPPSFTRVMSDYNFFCLLILKIFEILARSSKFSTTTGKMVFFPPCASELPIE